MPAIGVIIRVELMNFSMQKSFMQPGPMGAENQGIIVNMLHSAFLHTVSIAWLPQGIKVSIAFGKPSNTTTLLQT